MAEIHEHDAMSCRACGREERASEGYPCANCGTFICLICTFRGVTRCRECAGQAAEGRPRMSAVIARAAVAPAATPSRRSASEQVTQLVLGETAAVLEADGEWRRVRTDRDGYEGWVHAGYCVEVRRREPRRLARRGHRLERGRRGATSAAGRRPRLPLRARVALGARARPPARRPRRAAALQGTSSPLAEVVRGRPGHAARALGARALRGRAATSGAG